MNEGVRRAYTSPDNPLRASMLADPAGSRKNTRDNTPAMVYRDVVPGDRIEVRVAQKAAARRTRRRFAMLNPSDSVVDWMLSEVPTMGGGWCPPGMLGVGIGGSAEKAMMLAKESLLDPIDMHELKARGPKNRPEELRIEIFDKVNALGIGAQGLGGLTTVLDVKVRDYPTHAASLPVAVIPNCAATRHVAVPSGRQRTRAVRSAGPQALAQARRGSRDGARRVNLDTLTKARGRRLESGRTAAALREDIYRPRCRA